MEIVVDFELWLICFSYSPLQDSEKNMRKKDDVLWYN